MLFTLALLAVGFAPPDFDREVAPLLAARCLSCHGADKPKGGLDLSARKVAFAGGESGASVVPGKPADSPLVVRTAADEMPPKHPLTTAEKAILSAWVTAGAKWGTDPIDPFAVTTSTRAGRDWWSLKPITRPAVPILTPHASLLTPIDAFVRAKLREKGLSPSLPADPRTLVRRVYFDLIGLPPPPEVIERFVTDPSDAAYRKLIDDLLARPQYGERWARHWLDVARYGESDGFERNQPRPTAWPYRDWVIRAMNDDLPFDQFARMQIAGDVGTDDPAGVAASGFLVAGVHNTVLGSNAVANATARQDELEDVVSAVSQAFLGLSVQCARCHDHKFDPITQVDYYRMAASLAGVTHGERTTIAPTAKAEGDRLRADVSRLNREIAALELTGRKRVTGAATLPVPPYARWSFDADANDEAGRLPATLLTGAKLAGGRLVLDGTAGFAVTATLPVALSAKTLEVWATVGDLNHGGGGVMTVETPDGAAFDSIVFAERQPRRWMPGSDFHRRTRDLTGPAEDSDPTKPVHVAIAYDADGTIRTYRNSKGYGSPYRPGPVREFAAGQARVLFGKRHTGGGRAFFRGDIDDARLYDRALTADEIAASFAAGPGPAFVSQTAALEKLSEAERKEYDRLIREGTATTERLAKVPAAGKVFATVSTAVDQFHVLARGSVEQKRQEVMAGGVATEFGLPATATDGQRRQALAAWTTSRHNPLFARVAVNRLWHHHFGVGLVDSPSDFGFNGGRPSHPELLDYLASELVARGYSVKAMHRLIVTSATYRQASTANPAAAKIDAENRLLWRKSPTRLDAEAVRDTMLASAGVLSPKVGGPPFHDVRTYFLNGTTYFDPIDPTDADADRRSVYRFTPRGERPPLLDAFDCPDPSAQTPRRQSTTTPLQALSLWNSAFVLRTAGRVADRVAKDTNPVDRMYRLALGRGPTEIEAKRAGKLVADHGLPALARVLFNSTEFVVIE